MKKSKTLSFLLAVILCVYIILPDVTAFAVEPTSTIYISSPEELASLAKNCSLDTWSRGKTVILSNDIDLAGTGFTSIPSFGGSFDGQGHTISGLSLTDYGSPQGLFRYVQEGSLIKRLTVKGSVTPTGIKSTVGGVVGSNSGTLQNCIFIGTISGDKYVGGIAGINEAAGLISNCSMQGIVYGEHYVGGITGENLGTILLSTNKANVNTTVVENTFSMEDIQNIDIESIMSFSTADVTDITDVGGIAGLSTGIIQSSLNSGTVGYTHVGYNIGGIVGRQSGYVNGSKNKGVVYGRKDVGGIAGQIEPYGTWQLSKSSLTNLHKELNTLQGLIENAINDANLYSAKISAQLNTTQEYVANAQTAGDSLIDQTASWLNDNLDSINDVSARITQTLVAMEPIMDSVSAAAGDMETAISQYKTAMQQLENASDSAKTGIYTLYPALDELDAALDDTRVSFNNISSALASLQSGLGDSAAVEAALSEMQTGINSLIAATGKISDSASALLDATNTLVNSEVWKENVPLIREGANELVIAANEMAAAMKSISGALTALEGDFDEEELSAALTSLESALANLETASEKSASGFSKISSGLKKIANSYNENDETKQAWQDIEEGMNMVEKAIGDGTNIDYAAALQGQAKILHGLTVLKDNTDIAEIREGLTKIYEGVQELADATEAAQAAAGDLQDMIDHLQAADTNPEKTKKDLEALRKGFADLATATEDAADAMLKINTALNKLLQSDEVEEYEEALRINLQKISDGIAEAIDAAGVISAGAEKLSKQIDLNKLSESIDYLKSAAGKFSSAISHMQNAISYVQNAWPYFEAAADSASKALASAKIATGTLESSAAAMADAVKAIHNLISELAAQPKITFQKLDSGYLETKDELSKAIGNISGSLSGLNATISDTSATMLADIQAISNQMFIVFGLLVDSVDNVSGMSTDLKDYTEDISTQNADSDTGGKIAASINNGIVQGDINVGGIAGSMAIEYDFDLEDDHNLTNKMSPGSKYLLRAIVSDSENYGVITAKKNCVGGIVGLMDFGYVVQSVDNGSISSSDGDYVGGIAGRSDGAIHKCYAKSRLSGSDYVGGIAGYGTDISNCYSLIRVDKANEFVGTIAGTVSGAIKENFFVNDALAAVNGISYAGKAEPISYDALLSVAELPAIFKTFRLSFVADDEEVAAIPFDYGETVLSSRIPNVPQKEGYYGQWLPDDFKDLTFDETIKAVYKQYVTTLASTQTRDDGLSVILVDGVFTTDSSLTATKTKTINSYQGKQVLEQWTLSIPEDGQASHKVRFLAPDKRSSGLGIYLLRDGKWQKAEYTTNGSYLLFDVGTTEVTFIVTASSRNNILIILSVPAALALIATLLRIRRKRRTKHSVVT